MAVNTTSFGLFTDVPRHQDEAIERVTAALKDEGFGILTMIDVQATVKEKLGVDSAPYVILGSCNPQLAHQVLEAEREIGLLLPCNVVVYQADGRSTTVAAMDPQAALSLTGNSGIEPIASEAKERLARVLARLADIAE
jgi:uncharacterized protein (DUF302 family)